MHLLENSLLKIMAQLKRGKSCLTYTRYIHIDLTENKILYSASLPQDRLTDRFKSRAYLSGGLNPSLSLLPFRRMRLKKVCPFFFSPLIFRKSHFSLWKYEYNSTKQILLTRCFLFVVSVKLCKKKDKHDLEGL